MSKKDNKTTSKNNPNARKKTIVAKQYNNTDVVPMMLLRSKGKRCIVAQYKNGSLVTNADGNPVMYSDI